MKLANNMVHIFTDGSCYPNPGGGGWGAVLVFNGTHTEVCGGKPNSTNNEMELTAIREALAKLKIFKYPVIVYTDSQYAQNAVTVWHHGWARNGWRTGTGTPVKNKEVIQGILAAMERVKNQGGAVAVKWVKGHNGHVWNERADALANTGRHKHGVHR